MFDHGYLAYKILSAQTPDTVLLKFSQSRSASRILDASDLDPPSGKPAHKIKISSLEN